MRAPRWSRRSRAGERAVEQIERALEAAERLINRESDKEALEALRSLPKGPLLEPVFEVRAGDCLRALGKLDRALSHYQAALAMNPKEADALHGLGTIYQEREQHAEMVEVWLEVREIDLWAPPPPWSISVDEFEQAAEAALAEIPEQTRRLFENLPIVAADYPDADLIREGIDPRSLGLITGIPYGHKLGLAGAGGDLDCVQLYQRNIERIATDRSEVLEEIRITVLHETGHYFGLSDDDLEEIGLG